MHSGYTHDYQHACQWIYLGEISPRRVSASRLERPLSVTTPAWAAGLESSRRTSYMRCAALAPLEMCHPQLRAPLFGVKYFAGHCNWFGTSAAIAATAKGVAEGTRGSPHQAAPKCDQRPCHGSRGKTAELVLRCGQGRGRTADLPIFSRTLVPTELPGRKYK